MGKGKRGNREAKKPKRVGPAVKAPDPATPTAPNVFKPNVPKK